VSDACASVNAQAGTSHNLGDNFARAFETRYLNEAGEQVSVPALKVCMEHRPPAVAAYVLHR